MRALIAIAAIIMTGCKTTPNPQSLTITGNPPVVVKEDNSINFGFHFRSTITADYAITPADCGFVLRTNSDKPLSLSLPLLPFPCALVLVNTRTGLVTVNITQTAPDGSGGDFNGEKTFTLSKDQSAIMYVNQSSAFYRGFFSTRAAGTQPPPQPAGASSYSDLSDFRVTQDSPTKLTISPGSFAIGSYSFPQPAGGSIEFTAGTGEARIYMSKLGILTTEAAVGTTAITTGQMVMITASSPTFPPGSIPIASLTLSNGTATISQASLASRVRGFALEPGPGISITYTQGVARISTDSTVARADAPGSTTATTATSVAAWSALIIYIAALIFILWRFR